MVSNVNSFKHGDKLSLWIADRGPKITKKTEPTAMTRLFGDPSSKWSSRKLSVFTCTGETRIT